MLEAARNYLIRHMLGVMQQHLQDFRVPSRQLSFEDRLVALPASVLWEG